MQVLRMKLKNVSKLIIKNFKLVVRIPLVASTILLKHYLRHLMSNTSSIYLSKKK